MKTTLFENLMEALQDVFEDHCMRMDRIINKDEHAIIADEISYFSRFHHISNQMYTEMSGVIKAAIYLKVLHNEEFKILLETREQYNDSFYDLYQEKK